MTFLDYCMMNGHSIIGGICQLSDGRETDFCQCLLTNLQGIPKLTKMTNSQRCFFHDKRDRKILSPVLILPNQWC
jgi:hypothetical protein